jgi:hypothetical protein
LGLVSQLSLFPLPEEEEETNHPVAALFIGFLIDNGAPLLLVMLRVSWR